jgi:hypothetical protein
MILVGERMSARGLGLVVLSPRSYIPKENFMKDVMDIALRAGSQPPGAVEYNKQLMMAPLREEPFTAPEWECERSNERASREMRLPRSREIKS